MEQITGNGKYQYNHAKKKQAKFKVGDVCYATHEKFVGLIRVIGRLIAWIILQKMKC